MLQVLPGNGAVDFLRHNNFAGWSFSWDSLRDIEKFYHERRAPEHEFLDVELERLRQDLRKAITALLSTLALQTFPTGGGRSSVPEEWETEQYDRFNRVVAEIHGAANDFCNTYDALVRSARQRLLK